MVKINTPLEENLHKYIKECQDYPRHGIVALVFPELPQSVVDQMHEEIESILEEHLDTTVHVDV